MASSRMRGTFIRNVQNSVLRNERRRFEETSLFLDELYKQIEDNVERLRDDYRKLGRRQVASFRSGNGADPGLDFRMKWTAELGNNLKAMRDNIVNNINTTSMEHFINTYTKTYDSNIETFGLNAFFTVPDRRAIVEAINYPWSGKMWSDRVWTNTNKVTEEIRQKISGALIRGDSYVNVAKELDSALVQQGQRLKYVTERIIRTETARVRYVADDRFYKEANIEELEFLAMIDHKTSEACRGYNGKVFKLGSEPSIPVHPHCRSTYVPVIPDISKEEWVNRIKEAKALDNPQPKIPPTPVVVEPTPKPKKSTTTKASSKKGKKVEDKVDKLPKPTKDQIEKSKKIADSFSKTPTDNTIISMERNLKYGKERFKNVAENRGEWGEKEKKRFNKLVEEQERVIKEIREKGGYLIMDEMGTMNLENRNAKYPFNYVKYQYFQPRRDGTYFISINDKLTKAEEEKIYEYCDTLVANNPRLIGSKISINNSASEKKSGQRSKNMGFYSPAYDYLSLRDFKGYNKALTQLGYKGEDTDGEKEFVSTLYHELAHRNHSKSEKLKDVTLTPEEWGEWENLIEPLYDKYRRNKEVKFRDEWKRFDYPVNAQDYYKDGGKEHFYQEMWAESQAVIYNDFDKEAESERGKLDKYFPQIEEFMRKLIK